MIAIERVLTEREYASESRVRRHDTAPAASLWRGCTADVPGHLRGGVGRCCRRPDHCHVATFDLGDVAAAARYPLVRRQAHVDDFALVVVGRGDGNSGCTSVDCDSRRSRRPRGRYHLHGAVGITACGKHRTKLRVGVCELDEFHCARLGCLKKLERTVPGDEERRGNRQR